MQHFLVIQERQFNCSVYEATRFPDHTAHFGTSSKSRNSYFSGKSTLLFDRLNFISVYHDSDDSNLTVLNFINIDVHALANSKM